MVDSVKSFSFASTPKIFFGLDTVMSLGKSAANYGNQVALITGGSSYDYSSFREKLEKSLSESGSTLYRYIISGEPSPELVDNAVTEFKTRKIDLVVAIGGGSVLDAGKAISAMLKEEGSVKDFLEGVGTQNPSGRKLPLIAVPTTSGTGSEATNNAVITKPGNDGFKKSLRHDNYVPDIAIVDPALMLDCPPNITAASGMDAFTQLLESYLSDKANAMTDALAYSGLTCIASSLLKAFKNGDNLEARSNMSYAALISGITLSNAGLGLIHGFAQPLGSIFPIPHGVVCGGLMGVVNRKTVEKLRESGSNEVYLKKYAQIGKLFTLDDTKQDDYYIELLLDNIDDYIEKMNIPRLKEFGVTEKDFGTIINQTALKNHPVKLTESDLHEILLKRL